MRRRLCASVLLLALSACSPSSNDPANDSNSTADANVAAPVPQNTTSLLQAGSPQVCDAADVEQMVLSYIQRPLGKDPTGIGLEQEDMDGALRQVQPSLEAITFAGANPQIGSVDCDANYILRAPGNTAQLAHAISYNVRPAVDQSGGIVVHSNIGQWADEYESIMVGVALMVHGSRVQAARAAQQQAAAAAAAAANTGQAAAAPAEDGAVPDPARPAASPALPAQTDGNQQ